MNEPIRILVLEDLHTDFEIAQREIRKAVKGCEFQRVETRKDFLKALEVFQPDLILSDYSLPRFDGMKALKLTLEHAPLTPLIIWTGSMTEDIAAECIKAGANNYVLKENKKRLGIAVTHALDERRLKLKHKQAEEKYRAIFESSVEGIFQSTPQGRFISVNPAMARIYGYASPEEMIESVRNIADQIYAEPDDRNEFIELLQAKGVVENFEMKNLRKDGSIFWSSTSARVVRDAEQNVLYYEGFLQDITQRKQAEKKQRENKARYRALFEQSHDAIFILDFQGRHLDVNQRAADMLGYTTAEMMGLSIRELSADPQQSEDVLQRLINGENLPVYERRLRKKDGGIITVELNVELVRDVDGNPVHIQSLVRDISERKKAEEALTTSERRFRAMIENGLDDISLLGVDGTLLWESPAVHRNLGYAPSTYSGRSLFELMHPDDLEWTNSLFSKLTQEPGSHQMGVFRLRHADGTWRWIEAIVTNMLNEPSVNAIVVNYRDVTERKQAEEALQSSEAKFRSLVENSLQGISIYQSGKMVYANPALCKMNGYTAEELRGMSADELIALTHPDDRDIARERAEKRQNGEELSSNFEFRIIRKDGSIAWWQAFNTAINFDGKPAVLSTVLDITERKQAEEKLRESEKRLIQALTAAQMSVWEWDLDTNNILWSPEFFEITGMKKDDLDRTFESFTNLIHPEDAERVRASAQKALADETLFAEEFRITRSDGEVRWLSNLGRAEHDPSSKYLRLIGTVQDITQRKQAELERQALLEIVQGLGNTKDLQEFLNLIHRSIANVIYAENFFVAFYHKNTGQFEEIYSVDEYDPPLPPSKMEKSITAYVYRTGEPLLLNKERFHELEAQGLVEMLGTDSASWLGVPLKTQHGIIGVIVVQDYERPNRYTEHDKEFLASIASQVALAIERKLAEDELRKGADILSQAGQIAHLGAWEIEISNPDDLNSNPLHWSDETYRIFGYEPGEVPSSNELFFGHVHPEDQPKIVEAVSQAIAEKKNYQTEHRILRTDGSQRIVFEHAQITYNIDGKPVHMLGAVQDITERKQAEQIEREQRVLAEALLDTAATLNSTLDYGEVLDHILNAVERVVPHEAATIMLIDEGIARVVRLRGYAERGLSEEAMKVEFALADTENLRQMFETGRPVVVPDTYSYPGWKRVKVTDWLRSNLGAPIIIYGEVIGFILLDSAMTGFFTPVHAEHLNAFANQAAIAIYNARLLHQAQEEITERKHAQEIEREQRTLVEALLDTAATLNSTLNYGEVLDHILTAVEHVVPHDAATIMLIDNGTAHAVRLRGHERRGFDTDVMEIKFQVAETPNLREMLETGQPLVISKTQTYPGWKDLPSTNWIHSNVGAPIIIQGQVIGFILLDSETSGFFTDVHAERLNAFANQAALAIHNARLLQQAQEEITERKHAEEALRESEEKYRLLFDSNPLPMWIYDLETLSFLKVNDAAVSHYGYSVDEFMSMTIKDIRPSEDVSKLLENVAHVTSGIDRAGIWRHCKKDGTLIHVEVVSHTVEFEGRHAELILVNDVTEREKAEIELRKSEERFRQLADNIEEVFWMTDIGEDEEETTYISPAAERVWGRSTVDELVPLDDFMESIWPEDRDRMQDAIVRQRNGERTDLEYRIIRPDGSVRWIWDRAFPIVDDSGRVARLAGIAADITEKKQTDIELKERQSFLQSIMDSAPGYIVTNDLEGNFLYANRTWPGQSEEEFRKTNLLDIIHPEHRASAWDVFQRAIKTKTIQRTEQPSLDADGKYHWFEVIHSPIIVDNKVDRVTSFVQDITERKQADTDLRESQLRFAGIVNSAMDAIISADSEQRIVLFNPSAEQMFGCKAADAIGQPLERFIPERYRAAHHGHVATLETAEAISRSMENENMRYGLRADGEEFPIEASISHIQVAGQHLYTAVLHDISERKEAEDALRESEARFMSAFEFAPIGIALVSTLGGWLKVNNALCNLVGYTEQELMAMTFQDITHPDNLNTDLNFVNQMLAGEINTYQMEKRYIHKLGHFVWALLSVSAVKDNQGNLQYFVSQIQDITERKQAEKEIARQITELEAVYENGLAIGQLLEPREIGERIMETFARYLSWHHVTIRLRKEDSDELELVAFNLPGLKEEDRAEAERNFTSRINRVGQGMSGWVAQTGLPIRSGDVRSLPQYVDTHEDIQSGLYMPIRIGERVIGVISVESEKANALTAQDQRLLATLANQAAIAFENARLYQSTQQELIERKRMEQELRKSQESYLDLFENSPIATWLEDFSEVDTWMKGLRTRGVTNLEEFLKKNPEELKYGVGLIRVLNVNQAALGLNGASSKEELIGQVHNLLREPTVQREMINELNTIWNGFTSFGFEMSSRRLDGGQITGIQRIFIPSKDGSPDFGRVILTSTDISERIDIERALRASEIHYRELADSITDIFFELDHNLCFSHWNIASEALTGVPAKFAIGKSLRDIFGESAETDKIEKIYESVLIENQPKTFETFLTLSHERRFIEINAYPSVRGVSVVAKDVTDRKRSETILEKRFELMEYSAHHSLEEVMQRAVDEVSKLTNSEIGFFHFMEADQTTPSLQTWSTETLKLFDIAPSEGMHLAVDQAGVWAEALRQRGSVIQNDYESLPNKKGVPKGHVIITREMVIPIIRNEKIVAAMGIGNKPMPYTHRDLEIAERFADYAWDITERKEMEITLADERNQLAQRVEERTADLSRANSNLARALRVKDEFLANMSHELRTPLNAILGLSESLAEQTAGPLNEKQIRYISTIGESGHHLLSLINDILDLAKIEAGQITLDITKVDVNSVCQASLRMIKQLAQKKNQNVMLKIDEGLGLIWADERRLKQMMVNLLSNAVKFTPEGGRLGLDVRGNQEENKVSITAWDNGIGISERDMTQLFLPFVQLDSGLAREVTGTGLGLTLVAQMARLHGGSVTVTSEPGKGSRFTIMLPWEPALAVGIAERKKVTGKLNSLKLNDDAKPIILLVEDTQEVTMMISDYLESNGYKVVTAQDGVEGVVQAKAAHPNLILMDIMMPRMDGFDTTRALRNEPNFKFTPIIGLTALAMPNDRDRCIEAGMNDYISKPVNLRALVKTIRKYLPSEEEAKLP